MIETFLRPVDLPPVWLALLAAAGWALQRALPLPVATPGVQIAGQTLVFLGLALAAWSALSFFRRRTSIIPGRTASALVADGPYRLSRNPIYLADLVILLGFGLVIGSLWPVLLTPLLAWILLRRFILPEEAMLKRAFPEDFAAWSARVRRWI